MMNWSTPRSTTVLAIVIFEYLRAVISVMLKNVGPPRYALAYYKKIFYDIDIIVDAIIIIFRYLFNFVRYYSLGILQMTMNSAIL